MVLNDLSDVPNSIHEIYLYNGKTIVCINKRGL